MPDQEGDFILRVHIEQFGPEEESDSDSDTLIETRALMDRSASQLLDERSLRSGQGRATPMYGSQAGRGNQLYGSRGGDRATPLYGSRLQLEHQAQETSSERSSKIRNG